MRGRKKHVHSCEGSAGHMRVSVLTLWLSVTVLFSSPMLQLRSGICVTPTTVSGTGSRRLACPGRQNY